MKRAILELEARQVDNGEGTIRIKLGSGLLLLNLLVVVLAVVIFFLPSNILRIILGFPFVLFFPGYALMAALYVRKAGMGGIERIALTLGLSIAVVALIGLILNYTPWGIRLESMLSSTAFFIFIMSVIAWLRRKSLLEEERFAIEFRLGLPSLGTGTWGKILSLVLVITILGALGMVGYVIATPKVGQQFTEFYVLGLDGTATDYPGELVVGEEGRVTIGIINNEYEIVSYQVEVKIDGIENNEVKDITLEHNRKWEHEVSFTPEVAGARQKVEFFLYKNGENAPCFEPLRLWIDVI